VELHRILDRIEQRQEEIFAELKTLHSKIDNIMKTLADLQADVTAEDTVIDSAETLLAGIVAQLKALQPNQAAIDALATDIEAKTASLSSAVAANTPAA
jgi:chromosome segregation ATPase